MQETLCGAAQTFEETYRRQVDTVYRVCYLYLRNPADAEDAAQTAFLKLLSAQPDFADAEHEKAWLIVTASNVCKNLLRARRHDGGGLDRLPERLRAREFTSDETLPQVLALPEKYKLAIYLHYYEGYQTAEIARFLKVRESTARSWLFRGRKLLKLSMEEDAE